MHGVRHKINDVMFKNVKRAMTAVQEIIMMSCTHEVAHLNRQMIMIMSVNKKEDRREKTKCAIIHIIMQVSAQRAK